MTAKIERQSDYHSQNLLNSLKKLQMNGKLCDVTVAIGDKEMRVHKTVLIAASDYFEAMFTHETKESRTGKIEFPSTPPEIVKQCIDFIYTGKAEFSLENPEELIHASDMMQLHNLTNLYIEFLIENLSIQNCAEYLMLAWTYGKNIFEKPIENFISKNCPDFTKARKFTLLSKEHLVYCLNLLPKANKISETHKWKAIITWVTYDSESRKNIFVELFELLHLSVFSKEFIKDEIYKEQLVKESLVCANMIVERLLTRETMGNLTPAEESTEFKTIYAVSNTGQALHQYSSLTKEWSKYADLPKEICNTTLSSGDLEVINDVIYMGLGNSLWRCANTKWTKLYSHYDKNKRSCYNKCVTHGNSVYMVTSEDVIEYNITSNTIDRISSGPGLIHNFAVMCAAGAIYAMGGGHYFNSIVQATDDAYRFNLGTKIWQRIGSLKSKRERCTSFCFDDKPYVLGGTDKRKNVGSVECYEVSTDRWYVVPDLEITCSNAKVYKRDQLCILLPGFKFHQIELSRLRLQVKKGLADANVDESKACIGF